MLSSYGVAYWIGITMLGKEEWYKFIKSGEGLSICLIITILLGGIQLSLIFAAINNTIFKLPYLFN